MEIIFELLFELVGEFLLAFVVEAFGSLFSSLTGRATDSTARNVADRLSGTDDEDIAGPQRRGRGWPLRLMFGAALGAASLYFFPHSFAKAFDTRLAVLIGVPLACGLAMGAIGALKRKRNQEAAAIDSFRIGFLFALPFVAVRFLFTT